MEPQHFVPRDVVIELCERLGHNPNHVSRIVIEHDHITFEYRAPLTREQLVSEQTDPH